MKKGNGQSTSGYGSVSTTDNQSDYEDVDASQPRTYKQYWSETGTWAAGKFSALFRPNADAEATSNTPLTRSPAPSFSNNQGDVK